METTATWWLAVAIIATATSTAMHIASPDPVRGQEAEPSALQAPMVRADTLVLTLDRAEEIASEASPVLAAARSEEDIARGELRQARTYRFNPSVEFESRTLDPPPGSDVLDRYEAVVAQEIEWAGQWGLRRDAAGSGLRAGSASVEDAERQMARRVRAAFYEAVSAARVVRVAREIAEVSSRLRDAVQVELEEGEVSILDANLAEIEYGRGQARILSAQRGEESALLELKRVIGLEPEVPVRVQSDASASGMPDGPGFDPANATSLPDPMLLNADSLVTVALERRPDLRRASALVDRADQLERLARREAFPNLRLAAPIQRETVGGSPQIGLGVGLSVPLWNRNQGIADARQAELSQARYRQDAVVLDVRTDVRDALQAYRSASQALQALESSVVGPAAMNLELVEQSYRAGKIDLATLLLLQNQLLDAQTEYWRAWLDQRLAWTRLRAAIGEDTSSATGDQP